MEGVSVVFFQPLVGVEIVVLLAPEEAGDGLAHHVGSIRGHRRRGHRFVEFISLAQSCGQGVIEVLPEGEGAALGLLARLGRCPGG
jgi:hypothetical protein